MGTYLWHYTVTASASSAEQDLSLLNYDCTIIAYPLKVLAQQHRKLYTICFELISPFQLLRFEYHLIICSVEATSPCSNDVVMGYTCIHISIHVWTILCMHSHFPCSWPFFYLLISLHLEEVTVVMTISGSLYALYGSTWLTFVVAMLLAAVVVDYIKCCLTSCTTINISHYKKQRQ